MLQDLTDRYVAYFQLIQYTVDVLLRSMLEGPHKNCDILSA